MLKLVYPLRRLPNLTREQFQKYWYETHGPLVRKHQKALAIQRYAQVHTLDDPLNALLAQGRGGQEPYDGVAELWWQSRDDMEKVFRTLAGQAAARELLEDEMRFIDLGRSSLWVANERPVISWREESAVDEGASIGFVFSTLTAYQRSGALKGALDLDLFTAIGEGNATPAEIAERCRASERGIRILCDALVVFGFLAKQESRYALAPVSEMFLDRRAPSYAGSVGGFVTSPMLVEQFNHVAAAVRKGGTVVPEQGSLAPEHPMWVDFARAMGPMAAFQSQLLANLLDADRAPRWKVLDIAAGHGEFGIGLAKRNPNAEIVALDWPNVLAVAEENARAAGVESRFRTLPGSALEIDYGKEYDLVLLPNFLHHFDPDACDLILRKVHAALEPGGRAVTVEFVPNEDRVSPAEAAAFSLTMLVMTPGGDAYTFAELERMFRKAGFSQSELHELPPAFHRAVISLR
ncbi:MAG: EthD family reductase [Candidatus Binatia bacterium]